MPNNFDRAPGGPGGFDGPRSLIAHLKVIEEAGGFGLGSILLAGSAAAAAGALIGKALQNQTQNTTRKTKDVTNDDDGFVW